MISNTHHAQSPRTLTLEQKFLQNANIYQTFYVKTLSAVFLKDHFRTFL